ncbi:alpha/beta fold hydrolase [Cupriavidus metallidurans]|uniref:alpha/beta fold hydrolase n=1 Tax=Cupriavidus metallidurans TaxID=119219 RepID=UPI000CE00970|nr:alpha/beta hydrolase [Cupriavidus metallidurans]AVA35795.1 alpha/beta hydrolase [Cupriavidus metallidurans]
MVVARGRVGCFDFGTLAFHISISTACTLPTAVVTLADAAALDAASSRFVVPCGDGDILVRAWGLPGGRPTVLLHGGSGSWVHWARNISALVSAGRRVWVPDLPGFGDSARPPLGTDADALPEPVERALDQLLDGAAYDLVAFSFGTMVASFIAARWPHRVRRLVLVGAPALGIGPANPLGLRAWMHLSPGPERDDVMHANMRALMLAREATTDDDSLAFHLYRADLLRDRMPKRRLHQTDVIQRTLPAVRCPLFGIWGEQDALYRGRTDLIAGALSKAPAFRWLRIIPNAGHWVQFEEAAAFDKVLDQALTES